MKRMELIEKRIWNVCTIVILAGLLAASPAVGDEPTTKPESKDPMAEEVSVALKGMKVEQIANFLTEKLNKPVMVTESIKAKTITIISKKKMPLKDALFLIRRALLDQGIMIQQLPEVIRILPVTDVLRTMLPHIPADQSAADLPDVLEIVTKDFKLDHYNVRNMLAVLTPMMSSFGKIWADPDAGKVVVTDVVINLQRIERLIENMDIPLAERTLTEIIQVEHGDASEIVAILKYLIAGKMGIAATDITTIASTGGAPGGQRGRPGGRPQPGGGSGAINIQPSTTPVTLVPLITRNMIIAVAPAEVMKQIKIWVTQFDKPREDEKEHELYELYDLKYADANDVAQRIGQAIQAMPQAELRKNTHVVPFGDRLMVFGSKVGRSIVKDLLRNLDVENAEKRKLQKFILKHTNAEDMAERIETLFSNMDVAYQSRWGTSYRQRSDAVRVKVVSDKRMNAITVITDPMTMKKIEKIITEEDIPIDPDAVQPMVYEIIYINAGEMRDLLSSLFSKESGSSRSFWDYYFGSGDDDKGSVAVRLQGQFTFKILPGTNRLIVYSNSSENYKVIEKLLEKLDQPQTVGLPEIIELEYANAEDLCEQLNAMLSEFSTISRIRRARRGLPDYTSQTFDNNKSFGSGSSSSNNKNNREQPDEMIFWWQSYRPPPGQMPTSNLIGKIRIVPVVRRNALMVLAPEGYKKPVREMIKKLDKPGRQVIIKARIGEISHEGQTTLGLRIASDPSLLSSADSAIGGSAAAAFLDTLAGGRLTLSGSTSVTALLNLLVKEFDLKILLEPSLTTSDNEAAVYFDGQEVPVEDESRGSAEGTTTVTNIIYKQVGTLLQIRPHITKNNMVDLEINLEISRVVPGVKALGNFIFDRRQVTTHVIVGSGQTILLSGIIRQDEFEEIHKVPLLGDIPFIGRFFRSIDKGVNNREMVVFLTPHVIDIDNTHKMDAEMRRPRKVMAEIEQSFNGEDYDAAADEDNSVESEDSVE